MTGMPGMGTMSGTDPADSLSAPSGRGMIAMIRHPMMPGLEGVRPAVTAMRPHVAGGAVAGLRRVRELALRAGGDLSLAAAAGIVLRLLTLISAADLVPVYASVAVAVAAADDGAVTVSGGPRV